MTHVAKGLNEFQKKKCTTANSYFLNIDTLVFKRLLKILFLQDITNTIPIIGTLSLGSNLTFSIQFTLSKIMKFFPIINIV